MGRATIRSSVFFTIASLLLGCGSKQDAPQRLAEQEVGPSGGTVTASNGITLVIPAGALSDSVTITVDSLESVTPPQGTEAKGPAFAFGPEGTVFTQPVKVTLPWNGTVPEGRRVILARAAAGGAEWTLITEGAGFDETHAWAETTGFSWWMPVLEPLVCKDGETLCWDGSCRPDAEGCGGGPGCQPPATVCSMGPSMTTCTDLGQDSSNCGRCGNRCEFGNHCEGGVCVVD